MTAWPPPPPQPPQGDPVLNSWNRGGRYAIRFVGDTFYWCLVAAFIFFLVFTAYAVWLGREYASSLTIFDIGLGLFVGHLARIRRNR